ncbi:sterol esterase precursor, partial [Fusarium albosuccineum]
IATGLNGDVPAWAYMASYNQGTPILGTFHGSDLIQVFFGIKDNYAARSIRAYYISFVNSQDPNIGLNEKYPSWPKWKDGHKLVQFFADKSAIIGDDFRSATYDFLVQNFASFKF